MPFFCLNIGSLVFVGCIIFVPFLPSLADRSYWIKRLKDDILIAGEVDYIMKQLQLGSTEMQIIIKNLQLENMSLSPTLQQKAIEIINAGIKITPDVIKGALKDGKI